MATSDDFKQELRVGNLTRALKLALSEAIELKITTWVVPPNASEAEAQAPKPGDRMQTRINILDGDIETEVGPQFLTSAPYTELRDFHIDQVRHGRETIQKNLIGLQRLFTMVTDMVSGQPQPIVVEPILPGTSHRQLSPGVDTPSKPYPEVSGRPMPAPLPATPSSDLGESLPADWGEPTTAPDAALGDLSQPMPLPVEPLPSEDLSFPTDTSSGIYQEPNISPDSDEALNNLGGFAAAAPVAGLEPDAFPFPEASEAMAPQNWQPDLPSVDLTADSSEPTAPDLNANSAPLLADMPEPDHPSNLLGVTGAAIGATAIGAAALTTMFGGSAAEASPAETSNDFAADLDLPEPTPEEAEASLSALFTDEEAGAIPPVVFEDAAFEEPSFEESSLEESSLEASASDQSDWGLEADAASLFEESGLEASSFEEPVFEEPVFESGVLAESAEAPFLDESSFEESALGEPSASDQDWGLEADATSLFEESGLEASSFEEPVFEEPVFESGVLAESAEAPFLDESSFEESALGEPSASDQDWGLEADAASLFEESGLEASSFEEPVFEDAALAELNLDEPAPEASLPSDQDWGFAASEEESSEAIAAPLDQFGETSAAADFFNEPETLFADPVAEAPSTPEISAIPAPPPVNFEEAALDDAFNDALEVESPPLIAETDLDELFAEPETGEVSADLMGEPDEAALSALFADESSGEDAPELATAESDELLQFASESAPDAEPELMGLLDESALPAPDSLTLEPEVPNDEALNALFDAPAEEASDAFPDLETGDNLGGLDDADLLGSFEADEAAFAPEMEASAPSSDLDFSIESPTDEAALADLFQEEPAAESVAPPAWDIPSSEEALEISSPDLSSESAAPVADPLASLFGDSAATVDATEFTEGLPNLNPDLSVEESLAVLFGESAVEPADPPEAAPNPSSELSEEALAALFSEPPVPEPPTAMPPELAFDLETGETLDESLLIEMDALNTDLDLSDPFADFNIDDQPPPPPGPHSPPSQP